MSMEKFLRVMVDKGASDLFITAGVPASIKVHGRIMPLTKSPLAAEQSRDIVLGLMNKRQRDEFDEH